MQSKIRIAKYIANAGYCSRRDAEKLIEDRLVKINNQLCMHPSDTVNTNDKITVGKKIIVLNQATKLWKIYKPIKYICSTKDEYNRKKIFDIIPKNLPRIISIGRLTDQKDHLTLLKAAKLINPNLNPVVTIIGKGQNYFMLKNFIKNNNLSSIVKLVGYHPKPYVFFNKANIFVLTSIYEGLPNVLLEAQFFKKYIISTNCPTGPKEILLNGQAGDLINIRDYKNLSKLINSYMKRKKKISTMIKNGTKNFKRYDYSTNCKKYLNFVNENF